MDNLHQIGNLTPAQFQAMKQAACADGAAVAVTGTLPMETGSIEGHGVAVQYTYNESESRLYLTGTSKPWIVSWGHIWGTLDQNVPAG